MPDEAAARSFCSLASRAACEDPIGTAIPVERFLLVELPLPWAYRLEDSPGFPPGLATVLAAARARGARLRLLALAPDEALSQPGRRRVVHYRRPAGPFARFERLEHIVAPGRVGALAAALLGDEDLGAFEADREPDAEARDLLVCTHGAVDACCGRFGYPLYRSLRDAPTGPGLRVWRTSHFGGHRLAPTMIDLPYGRYWGHLDREAARAIAGQTGPVAALARHQRGWCGLDFFGQVAERAAFEREGWAWLEHEKLGRTLSVHGLDPADAAEHGHFAPLFAERPPSRAEVRLEFRTPGGDEGAYEAQIEFDAAVLTAGGCGEGPSTRANRYRVARLARTGPS